MDEFGRVEEKIYVALPERWKDGRNTLSWVLNNFSNNDAKIIVAHVHVPAQLIPMSKHSMLSFFSNASNKKRGKKTILAICRS
jgi:hypothetical protein